MFIYNVRFSFTFLEYTFDNRSFTEQYCINKDKPELKCNGKCELMKKANETEKQNNKKFQLDNEVSFIIPKVLLEEWIIQPQFFTQQDPHSSCNLFGHSTVYQHYPPPKLVCYLYI